MPRPITAGFKTRNAARSPTLVRSLLRVNQVVNI